MSAALAWLDQTLDTHGEVLADGRVRVRRSQAALAEEAGCSAGTISYYLRVLGHAVSVTRGDGLVVDPRALGRIDGFDELARRRRRRGEGGQGQHREDPARHPALPQRIRDSVESISSLAVMTLLFIS